MVREGRVLISSAGDPDFGASYSVQVLEVGAQVTSGSSGNTITVRAGHGFAALDKLIVGTDTSQFKSILSVTSTLLTLDVGQTCTVSAGDLLVNLAADNGSSIPLYDGAGLTVYSDMAYGTSVGSNTVSTDANGRYRYYHKGIARWELVRTGSTLISLYTDTGDPGSASYGIRDMSDFATSGVGTSASPWSGWDSYCVEGYTNYFPHGFYSCSTLPVSITQDNSPALTTIYGDGSGSSIITITGGTGQFRVYGTGTPPVTLHGVVVRGLCVRAGINNTSTGLASFENFDIGCLVDDFLVDTTASYSVAVGVYILNSEQCRFGSLYVRGWSSVALAAGNLTVGVKIYTDDGVQRGDVRHDSLYITNATTALIMSSSGGSIADTSFGLVKIVNGTLVDGTIGVSLASNVEQVAFGDLHVESFNNGLTATAVENLSIANGLFNLISNVAVSAGAAITITNGDGGFVMARIANSYNGIVLTGTTSRYFYLASASSSISGTLYTDSSSGANTHLSGQTISNALGVTGLLTATGGVSLATLSTVLTIATGVVTVTKSNHQLDTEAAAASDDLDTISGGTDGQILVLCCNNDSRTVVVKNATGNIKLNVAGDFSLNNSLDQIVLIKRNTNWIELTRSDNGA